MKKVLLGMLLFSSLCLGQEKFSATVNVSQRKAMELVRDINQTGRKVVGLYKVNKGYTIEYIGQDFDNKRPFIIEVQLEKLKR